MTRKIGTRSLKWLTAALLLAASQAALLAQVPAAAEADYNQYVTTAESRLTGQHESNQPPASSAIQNRVKQGELVIEKLTPDKDADPPGAMLHDWRGTAFAPGATASDFERVMRDFPAYSTVYAPQVLRADVTSHDSDQYKVTMRVKQKHVLTVVLDTAYDVSFGGSDPAHGWSTSRSTAISEIAYAGTDKERALGPKEEHGFLWRLNTYWTYEERDGGLYLQIESISLTRSIPAGLGWVARPFVESVPRESLEFTLRKTCEALKNQPQHEGKQ
jgi:hypothetical protein